MTARAVLAAVRHVASLLHGDTPSEARVCTGCGRTTRRLTPAQHARIGSKLLPVCARRRCAGVLKRAAEVAR